MITPIGEVLYGLAEGTLTRFKTRSGFQVGVRIVVPPFPFNDPETFAKQLERRGDPVQEAEPRRRAHRGREERQRRMGRDRDVRRGADRRAASARR